MAFSTNGTVNTIELIGRLGQDPELRHTNSGKAVVNLSLATNEKKGQEDVTSWHRITFWEKKAEIVNQYCSKGSKIRVTGCLQYRNYTDKDGNSRTAAEIDGNELTLLGAKSDSDGGGSPSRGDGGQQNKRPQSTGASSAAQVDDDEDIPF